MVDLTNSEGGFSFYRYKKLFALIGIEGLFILGLGLGWVFAFTSISSPLPQLAFFLCALGGLLVLSYVLYHFTHNHFRKKNLYTPNSIDLSDSIKAYKLHGTQVPLLQNHHLRSELVVISGKQSILVPKSQSIIIEHWSGPKMRVYLNNRSLAINSHQILQLPEQELEKWELQKFRLTIEPFEPFTDEDGILLIHLWGPYSKL
jgi:hypothetical protein